MKPFPILVSVIIPVYKVEPYLRQCVDSVISQTYRNIEIVLVDDGSPDNCPHICDEYAARDARVRVVHKENGGLSDARNAGINVAKGDYLVFLDSDDCLVSADCLHKLVNEIEKTKYKVYFLGNTITDEDSARKHCNHKVETRNQFMAKVMKGKQEFLTAWAFVCKRDFIVRNDLYFAKGLLHEDEEWMPRLLLALESDDAVFICNDTFYFYRLNRDGAITQNISEKNIQAKLFIVDRLVGLSKSRNGFEKKFLCTRAAQIMTGLWIRDKRTYQHDENLILQVKQRQFVLLKSSRIKHKLLYLLVKMRIIK